MGLRAELTEEVGDVFNEVWSELEGSDTVVKLLVAAENYAEFDEVRTLDGNWFFEYSNFRKNFLLEIAEDSDELTEHVRKATHVKVGDTVYVINDGDTTPPKATDVTWKIYCDLFEAGGQYS
jgi:hypothetical protein